MNYLVCVNINNNEKLRYIVPVIANNDYDAGIKAHEQLRRWEKEGYKITLETNVNGSKDTKVVYTDETYGTLPTPTYKGHTFLGWYSSLDNNGVKVTAETPLLHQEAHTYDAAGNLTEEKNR